MRDYPPVLRGRAKLMRRNPTEAEKRLWWSLRKRLPLEGSHFRRQVVIEPYIVDFANVSLRLIIEIDGAQHGEPGVRAYDAVRDGFLAARGWRLLRFWNHQVLTDMDSVIETVLAAVQGRL